MSDVSYPPYLEGMTVPMETLAARLVSAEDTILRVPEAVIASPALSHMAWGCVFERAPEGIVPLVERFDGGAIVQILFLGNEWGASEHLVGLASQDRIVAAVSTSDQGEADALYAGLAERVGLLSERCEGRGISIPAVYQYCARCT